MAMGRGQRQGCLAFPKHCHGSPKGTGKPDLEGGLQLCPGAFGDTLEIGIVSHDQTDVREAEMDEMWSFVHDKSQQYWLWWAIGHNTGEPRKGLRFSKTHQMHSIVAGLVMNIWFFGRAYIEFMV